jgi:hydroxyacylglutathione hydrolase
MNVTCLINELFNSNCYLIENNTSFCIIVDPGNISLVSLLEILKKNRKIIKAVIITHEHYDHIAGLNSLSVSYEFELICSKACNVAISNSKANLSTYIDGIAPYVVTKRAFEIDDGSTLNIEGHICTFFSTPGHSPGGICIKIGNDFFTGDTLLNNIKTPLTFPHSNRKHYAESLEKLKLLIDPGMMIYPGHGEPFIFESWNKFDWYKNYKK